MNIYIYNLCLVSKENDLDSNGSSLDTDQEDNTSHSLDNHQYSDPSLATPVPTSVLVTSSRITNDMHNVSFGEHDDYLRTNLSHTNLLHNNSIADPNLNHHNATLFNNNGLHHGHILPYFNDASNDRTECRKRSKTLKAASSVNSSNYDPNSDMNFLCDLSTPLISNRQSLSSQLNNQTDYFETDWTGRIVSGPNVIDHLKTEHGQQKITP